MILGKYFTKNDNKKIQCNLCPNNCNINQNCIGFCKIRKNIDGSLYTQAYNHISAINVDPIEKKPLYHFMPNSNTLSIGSYGCNMKCNFCQNHHISQNIMGGEIFNIDKIINILTINSCGSISYTYNEPTIWIELINDIYHNTKKYLAKNILISNGYINQEPLKDLIKFIDAFNIDVKTFSKEFYKNLHGDIDIIKKNIETIFYSKKHIEITTLIVPDLWTYEIFEKMCQWLSSLSAYIPLHINRYFPNYKYNLLPTNIDLLINYKNIADKYLKYVYIGNINNTDYNNSYCHNCNAILIERNGYNIKTYIKENRCYKCDINIPFYL